MLKSALKVDLSVKRPLADISPLEDPADKKIPEKPRQKRSTCLKRKDKSIYRRAFSETQLLDLVGFSFSDGESYHVITGGDVDSLSFLKVVLRQQDLDYCLFSTWCMASEDIYQIQDWLNAGKIKRMDAYVGEIFPNSYNQEWRLLVPIIKKYGAELPFFVTTLRYTLATGQSLHSV